MRIFLLLLFNAHLWLPQTRAAAIERKTYPEITTLGGTPSPTRAMPPLVFVDGCSFHHPSNPAGHAISDFHLPNASNIHLIAEELTDAVDTQHLESGAGRSAVTSPMTCTVFGSLGLLAALIWGPLARSSLDKLRNKSTSSNPELELGPSGSWITQTQALMYVYRYMRSTQQENIESAGWNNTTCRLAISEVRACRILQARHQEDHYVEQRYN